MHAKSLNNPLILLIGMNVYLSFFIWQVHHRNSIVHGGQTNLESADNITTTFL